MILKDTIVLGGGLAGIGYLVRNKNAFLIEKESKLFGHASSFKFQDIYFDQGAHICHSKDTDWLELINIEDTNSYNSTLVCNYHNGKWIGYPVQNNLKDITNKELAYAEIQTNLDKVPSLENYESWCIDVYGEYLTNKFYRVFTNKYWRTPMIDMNVNWLGGRILPIDMDFVNAGYDGVSKPQAVFKEYSYPKSGGFEALFDNLKKLINYDNVRLSDEVINIDIKNKCLTTKQGVTYRYNKLVSSLPLTELVKICCLEFPIDTFKYNNLILTAAVIEDVATDYPDWFYVYDENLEFSRVMNMAKLQGIEKRIGLQFETFRRNDEKYDINALTNKIEDDISALTGISKSRIKFEHKFIKYSYVVPTLGIEKAVQELKSILNTYGIDSIGLYGNWKYVWSDVAFMQGYNQDKI